MGLGTPSKRTPIGIEVTGRYIHAAQLSRKPRRWRIGMLAVMPRAATRVGTPLTAQEAAPLGELLYRRGFRGRDVVLAVPRESQLTGVIDVPHQTSSAAISEMARSRLATANRCEPESLEVACWKLPGESWATDGGRALAVGCRIEDANMQLDLFETADIDVQALDVHAWAAVRACRPLLTGTSRLVVILNVGWAAAHIVMLYDGVIVNERVLPEQGLQRLHTRLADEFGLEPDVTEYVVSRLGLSPDVSREEVSGELSESIGEQLGGFLEGLESELHRSLEYATQVHAPDVVGRLLVHGEGASMPGLDEHLASALKLDVKVVVPADVAECPTSMGAAAGSPALITAMGLAMHPGD